MTVVQKPSEDGAWLAEVGQQGQAFEGFTCPAFSLFCFFPLGYPGTVVHQAGLERMKLSWIGGLDRNSVRVSAGEIAFSGDGVP